VRWLPGSQSLLLAVADGVGSKHDSGEASLWAVQLALELADKRRPFGECVSTVARELREKLGRHGRTGATTLVLAELFAVDPSTAHLRLAAIGDSEVWWLAGGSWRPIYHRRASDHTEALPRHAAPHCQEGQLPPGALLVLATDGFARALFEGSPLETELASRWNSPPTEISFVNDVAFRDDAHLDDRTVLAVWTGAV
jgi:hypothetical protein